MSIPRPPPRSTREIRRVHRPLRRAKLFRGIRVRLHKPEQIRLASAVESGVVRSAGRRYLPFKKRNVCIHDPEITEIYQLARIVKALSPTPSSLDYDAQTLLRKRRSTSTETDNSDKWWAQISVSLPTDSANPAMSQADSSRQNESATISIHAAPG